MDKRFDIHRVESLMRLYWAVDAKRYFTGFLTLMGCILGIIIYNVTIGESRDTEFMSEVLLVLAMFFGMCFSGSVVGKPLAPKPRCIDFLMTPASTIEKFTARCLFYIVGFWIAFAACTVIVDAALCLMTFLKYDEYKSICFGWLDEFDHFYHLVIPASFMLVLQSMFVIGGTVWPKRGMVMTVAYLLVVNMALSLLSGSLAAIIASRFNMFAFLEDFYYWNFDLYLQAAMWGIAIINLALTAFNYAIAYHRLKEAEIVDRW